MDRKALYASINKAFELGLIPVANTVDKARTNYDTVASVVKAYLDKLEGEDK